MTRTTTTLHPPTGFSMDQVIEVRWGAVRWMSAATGHGDAIVSHNGNGNGNGADAKPNGAPKRNGSTSITGHCRAELVCAVQFVDADHVLIESWESGPLPVKSGGDVGAAAESGVSRRRQIIKRHPARCRLTVADDMTHVDVVVGERRLIALSIAADGRLLYAHSDLLADAGMTGGTYDKPTLTRRTAAHSAATA